MKQNYGLLMRYTRELQNVNKQMQGSWVYRFLV